MAARTIFAIFIALVVIATTRAAELRVGAATEVITPALGTPMDGYFSPRRSQGVDDDLHARALVIEQNGVKVALVVCDLVNMPKGTSDVARDLIGKSPAGIPADHVMLSATHTHTGPVVLRGSVRDPSEGDAATKVKSYTESLPELICKAVVKANEKLVPARASFAMGHEAHVSFNRRYMMKDGHVGWNPGKLNPKIERPAGPIDPDVPVVYFETADDKATPIATYTGFACHMDTIGSERISADFAAPLCNVLAKFKGPDMVTVFGTGAAGDINHIDVSTSRPQEGLAEARRIGTILGGEIIKTYARLEPLADGPLRVKSTKLQLDLPEIKPGDVEWARDVILKPSKARMAIDRVKAFKILDTAARKGKPLDVEVQVVTLGNDLAWVSMPGELFCQLGLDIKKSSPFKNTVIVELANGAVGYLPTIQAFAEGNYEPTNARTAPGSGERLVKAALDLLFELHGKHPTTRPSTAAAH
jgi:hypothetical protein